MALALVALSPVVVFHWHIGPVVAVITPAHGVHSGDALGVAALLAGLLLWPRHAGARRPITVWPGRSGQPDTSLGSRRSRNSTPAIISPKSPISSASAAGGSFCSFALASASLVK